MEQVVLHGATRMHIALIIYWCNVAAWMLPPFRQYRSDYFKYFFILALADPGTLSTNLLFRIHPLKIFMVISFLQLLSLITFKSKWNKAAALGMLIFIFCYAIFYSSVNIAFSAVILFHSVILAIIVFQLVQWIAGKHQLNLFLLALILYETSIILKMYFHLIRIEQFMTHFYVTTGFEILLAVFFIFFRIDDQRVGLRLSRSTNIADSL